MLLLSVYDHQNVQVPTVLYTKGFFQTPVNHKPISRPYIMNNIKGLVPSHIIFTTNDTAHNISMCYIIILHIAIHGV